jgi:hypothetical protein
MHTHICVPPLQSFHIYIITTYIFFVHYAFGLLWLLFVKVVLRLCFSFPICVTFFVGIGRGLFFCFFGDCAGGGVLIVLCEYGWCAYADCGYE